MSTTERARIAALTRHALHDTKEATKPALAGFLATFVARVDPDGVLDPAERERRANRLMQAHMLKLSARSAEVRRQRAGK